MDSGSSTIEQPATATIEAPNVLALQAQIEHLAIAKARAPITTEMEYAERGAIVQEATALAKAIQDAFAEPIRAADQAHKKMLQLRNQLQRVPRECRREGLAALEVWDQAQEEKRRQAEAELRRKAEAEQARRLLEELEAAPPERREAMIEAPLPAPIVAPPPAPPKLKGIVTKKVWKARVTDPSKIPPDIEGGRYKYLMPDEKQLNHYAKAWGGQNAPPGVQFYQETQQSVRTK